MAKKRPGRSGPDKYASRGAARGGRHNPPHPPESRLPKVKQPVSPNRRNGFHGGDRPYDYAFYEKEPATREYMRRLFARHDFPVGDARLEKFWLLYDLLRRHNASLDLTRIMGIEATVLKHFVDSAIILRWVEFTGPVLDIGTGPGFPGLPLAIMRPDLRFILAESRGKRVAFLEQAVRVLGLKNAVVHPRSVREDSPLGEDHGVPVGDVVTRALETIPPTLERVLPLVPPGAKIVFMKGPGSDGEIAAARSAYAAAYTLRDDIAYALPGTDQSRRLVVFEKNTPQ
ncbi:MAG: 16S rRNA (guanine(527)-N(7))-methyltransferase RsmG [Planctomycetota bacterium]|jgi:16S rRNA (guanine527-N7)-methyltransferase|nr:16S rRNA (guanine(527)-N(7))-methyltransferase RsmG [Planctomycetota bacterium]